MAGARLNLGMGGRGGTNLDTVGSESQGTRVDTGVLRSFEVLEAEGRLGRRSGLPRGCCPGQAGASVPDSPSATRV